MFGEEGLSQSALVVVMRSRHGLVTSVVIARRAPGWFMTSVHLGYALLYCLYLALPKLMH